MQERNKSAVAEPSKFILRVIALLLAAMAPAAATASLAQTPESHASSSSPTLNAVSNFYRQRSNKPLWFGGKSNRAPNELLKLLSTAEADGLDATRFELGALLLAIRDASTGEQSAVYRAELMLSNAFVGYAQELQQDPKVGVIYVDPELKPAPASPEALLEEAANAPSLAVYVRELRWMNPLYGQLRQALIGRFDASHHEHHLLSLNLQRARALPRTPGRYVLVNTANQHLYMYEGSTVVDEMKVVVGRAEAQTPLMNALVRYAVINPYWNVPSDLTTRLAPNVVKRGESYLKQQGYEIVSDFSDTPETVDPATIDWEAVVAGDLRLQMRQLPGPANSMGRIKFMFPNSQGVWLHDTPAKELFESSVRLGSAGCIRLEDAWRLGSWFFQQPLGRMTDEPEQQIALPQPVPVYITYLTAIPMVSSVRFVDDVYQRDPPPVDPVRVTSDGVGKSLSAAIGRSSTAQ